MTERGQEQTKGSAEDSILSKRANVTCRFDQPAFYKEARRILKPHGSLAAWAYTIPQVKGHKEASDLLQTFFKHTIGAYLSPAHKCYFAEYRDVEPQSSDFQIVERANVEFERPSSVRLLVHHFQQISTIFQGCWKSGFKISYYCKSMNIAI